MKISFIVLFGLLLFFDSCTDSMKNNFSDNSYQTDIAPNDYELKEKSLIPLEYVDWVNDKEHNLNKTKRIGEFGFTVFNKPVDYLICLDQRKEEISTLSYDQVKKEFGNLLYFDFKIEADDIPTELLKYKVGGEAEYQRRITYFAYEMQNDFCLVDNNDTLPCIMFHYERTYDIVPYAKVLLGFDPLKNNASKTFEFIYQDRVFSNGLIKFTFRKSDLENIPKLKTV